MENNFNKNFEMFKQSFRFNKKFRNVFLLDLSFCVSMTLLTFMFFLLIKKVLNPYLDFFMGGEILEAGASLPQGMMGAISTASLYLMLFFILLFLLSILFNYLIYSSVSEKKRNFWRYLGSFLIISICFSLFIIIINKVLSSFDVGLTVMVILGVVFLIIAFILKYFFHNLLILFFRTNKIVQPFMFFKTFFTQTKHFIYNFLYSFLMFVVMFVVIYFLSNLLGMVNLILAVAVSFIIFIYFDTWLRIYVFKNLKINKNVLQKDALKF